jgi:hypothetical protein
MQQHNHGRMNPIRKVVNLLMGMQKKAEAEGKQTTAMFDKFMCNVKTVSAGLQRSIADAEERAPQLESGIKETAAEHQQLAEDLKQAQEDRAKAEKAMATGIAIRDKDNNEFIKESNSQKTDIKAVTKAIKELGGKGGGGGGDAFLSTGSAFLQSPEAGIVRRLAMSGNMDLSNVDRDLLSSFLQGAAQEPSSGEILGIMKQMHDEMTKDLDQMQKDEESAVADSEALVSAKKKKSRRAPRQ